MAVSTTAATPFNLQSPTVAAFSSHTSAVAASLSSLSSSSLSSSAPSSHSLTRAYANTLQVPCATPDRKPVHDAPVLGASPGKRKLELVATSTAAALTAQAARSPASAASASDVDADGDSDTEGSERASKRLIHRTISDEMKVHLSFFVLSASVVAVLFACSC